VKAKGSAKAKGEAKGAKKGTAKVKAKATPSSKRIVKGKPLAGAVASPPMPKLGPMTAIKFLTCSIYAGVKRELWQHGKDGWANVVAKCRELSA